VKLFGALLTPRPLRGRASGVFARSGSARADSDLANRSGRTAAAALVGIAAVLALGAGSAPSARLSTPTLLDVGDSLSVGTAPYLRAQLHGYRIERARDVGLHAYDAARIISGMRLLPPVLVVSAGSNDDPRIVSTFAHAVSTIVMSAGSDRCVVWPTIVRPPAVGATYTGLNDALRRSARRHSNLVLVDWAHMVHKHPWWLGADGVHVSSAGYRARAAAIASAVTGRC
jgi:lysophospholipase L1-like esterase